MRGIGLTVQGELRRMVLSRELRLKESIVKLNGNLYLVAKRVLGVH